MPQQHTLPTVDAHHFAAHVSPTSGTVVLDFSADWCGPCRAIEPLLDDLAKRRADVRVLRVDADASPEIATRFRVRSLPTLVVLVNGEERARHTGTLSASALGQLVDAAAGAAALASSSPRRVAP